MKFNRQFKLTIQTDDIVDESFVGPNFPAFNFVGPSAPTTTTKKAAIEIASPLTIEFDIDRNSASTLNQGTFRVYNLSQKNRDAIFQNRFDANNASNGKRKTIIMQAGYGKELSTIFQGDLLEAYSYRQGSDVITYISAQDGSWEAYNSVTNTTLEAGTSFSDVINLLASNLGTKIGTISPTEGVHKRSTALNGNTFYLLTKDFKDQFFVDLGVFNKVDTNEVLKGLGGKVPLINSEAGLLGTPLLQGTNIVVDILFEPRINVAQLVQIQSSINSKFDGQFKVNGIRHSGIISDAVNGSCRTTLQLYAGNKVSGALKQV